MSHDNEKIVDLGKYVTTGLYVITGRARAWSIIETEKLDQFNANAHNVTFHVPPTLHSIMPACFRELMSFLPDGLDEQHFKKICRFDHNKTGIMSQMSQQWQTAAYDAYASRHNPSWGF